MTKTSARPDRYAPYPVQLREGMTAEEIYAAYGLTCPPRIATLRNPARKTYGPAVARISAQLGMPMMPHQRYKVDTALEVNPATGELVYRDVTALVPRQAGKTTVILSVKTHRALAFPKEVRRHARHQRGRQRILYAAQKRIDARDKFVDDHLPILKASPLASRFTSREGQGKEAILWDTGALDAITSNTEDAAHGKWLDLGVEDEFFHAEDARLEQAFSPAMLTRWSAQHWRVSTEGTEKSAYLADKVDIGREAAAAANAGEQTTICYFEWSNLDDPYDDPATWLSCMPALCPNEDGPCECSPYWRHTVTLATIRAELAKMQKDIPGFERAYLNRRRGQKPPPDPNLPTAQEWSGSVLVREQPTEKLAFGIELHMERRFGAIVAVWLNEDGVRRHMRVIEFLPGIDWVPGRAAELNERWEPLAWGMGLGGPCGTLLTPLKEAGIKAPEAGEDFAWGMLATPTSRQLAAGCGLVVDGIRGTTVDGVHKPTLFHEDQKALNDAFGDARTRPSGDAFTWARRAGGDVTCLQAGTSGLWALETYKHLERVSSYDPLANIG
ncbi:hypothetical protein K1W54_38130 [Micromonospora sp. CPCC 205371]|nr:hypothetical protein [Micromonospora sp. CPCC 205371]